MRPLHSILLLVVTASMHAQGMRPPASGRSLYLAADSAVSSVGSPVELSAVTLASSETRDVAKRTIFRGYAAGYFRHVMDAPGYRSPIGSFAATFTYAASGEIAGSNRNLLGWSLAPELNFTPHVALQANFTNLYVRSISPAQSRLVLAAGPRYNLALGSRITPFVYAEGGEVRRSTSGSIVRDWNPVVNAGVGLDIPIVRGFGLQIIPGEYTGQLNDDSTWLHTYSVRGGVVFSLFH